MALAFVLSVVVLAPAVGLAFDRFLFRKIAPANVIAKLVTGISMLVGLPAVLAILFTNNDQYNPPSILFNPDVVYFHVAGTPINGIAVTAVVATAAILVALLVLVRWTSLGLQMRGAVESRRLIELDGVNGGRVVASAWAISGLIAGLAGVLLAPAYGQLQFSDYADLMVAAFAAAAWAVLRSLPIAALVGVLMGVADQRPPGLPARRGASGPRPCSPRSPSSCWWEHWSCFPGCGRSGGRRTRSPPWILPPRPPPPPCAHRRSTG